MSKKKGKKPELDWADDEKATDVKAKKKVVNLASQAAEALSGLMEESAPAEEEVELEFEEVDSIEETSETEEEAEFSEEELLNLKTEDEEVSAVILEDDEPAQEPVQESFSGTELEGFASAEIDVVEEIPEDRIASIVESLLFATDRPQSVAVLKAAFKGTNVRSHHIRRALDQLQIEYAGARRGIYVEEVSGGYQLRTKVDNMDYLRRTVKSRPFRVSGPALEVMAIVAYKQPMTKHQIDEIRGVESGHLLRALMEKNLVNFAGKSDLPGKPMLYGTSRRFLEIFSLRNLNELPSLSEIDQLIPEGIGEVEEKETLGDLTSRLSTESGKTYSEGEEELLKISEDLAQVTTTTEFFEKEKERMKKQRDFERARDIREAMMVGDEVEESDKRWLARYDMENAPAVAADSVAAEIGAAVEAAPAEASDTSVEVAEEPATEQPNLNSEPSQEF